MKNYCNFCKNYTNICYKCGMCSSCYCCQNTNFRKCSLFNLKYLYNSTSFIQNKLPRLLGLEYEISTVPSAFYDGIRKSILKSKYSAYVPSYHRDGSVRPSEFEMVTQPMGGDIYLGVQKIIANHITTYIDKLDCNNTCGYHVHIDCSQETSKELRHFLYVYLKLEKEIYAKMCRRDRINNNACIPLMTYVDPNFNLESLLDFKMTSEDFSTFIHSFYGIKKDKSFYSRVHSHAILDRLKQNRRAFGYEREDNPRYAGLNIHAYYTLGTIEWRMKEGTLNTDVCRLWPLFCGWFTHIALTKPIRVLKQIENLNDMIQLMPKTLQKQINCLYVEGEN